MPVGRTKRQISTTMFFIDVQGFLILQMAQCHFQPPSLSGITRSMTQRLSQSSRDSVSLGIFTERTTEEQFRHSRRLAKTRKLLGREIILPLRSRLRINTIFKPQHAPTGRGILIFQFGPESALRSNQLERVLPENAFHYFPMNVGQSKIAALEFKRQPLVIES